MSSVSPAVPEAILRHLLVCKVVVFMPYGAELSSLAYICVRPAISVSPAVPKKAAC